MWLYEYVVHFLKIFFANVLKCGPIPRHIAFIMDGNRRYAKKKNMPPWEGHSVGGRKLSEIRDWCELFGIEEMTVYAFSIENFNRSAIEVEKLTKLMRDLILEALDDEESSIKINAIGNLSLIPKQTLQVIAKGVSETAAKKSPLNVAISYTSREEITNALNLILEGVRSDALRIEDITEDLISQCMYTGQSPAPDILIRTSGEHRLSDFLLWQLKDTVIHFERALWPDYSFFHFCAMIFVYQLRTRRQSRSECKLAKITNPRIDEFVKKVHEQRKQQIEQFLRE
ncbi:hypothetical protein PPYR_05858 [Photinus pyralis]|uniref:Alkyl transferase n=1 Tax=Photinus pyralis TaxID=7054 RepID=A0A1Y1L496_PHOPY|nr:hypothetical protein PPYR_06121 [Photinus pyralis]KAB0801504.1 hypothetical protein PPYR_05858 [Photinus pyralis]